MRPLRGIAAVAAGAILAVAGCADAGPASTEDGAGSGVYNGTDVMFLQMSLEHIRQGEPVVALAEKRAADPAVRDLTAELAVQWRTEAATMTGWLQEWKQPLAADPAADAHAGHGDLHSLRPSDVAELSGARGADFDRTALSLLLGHLHNGVETTRMEAGGGRYPPAIDLAAIMTTTRQEQIRRMLTLVA
jgi:uncharacterized protein (DUF305 family)